MRSNLAFLLAVITACGGSGGADDDDDGGVTPKLIAGGGVADAPIAGTLHGRAGNPTWRALEDAIGELDGGECVLFASGMAAIAAVLRLAGRDGALVLPSDGYYLARSLAHGELAPLGVDMDWYTTRERPEDEILPWDHLDSGLDKQWLWDDWQDALSEQELDDCRWTPCFDCGVCPSMDTEIQIGPTGRKLLPLTPVGSVDA